MEGWVFIPFESAVQKVTYTKKIPRKQFLTDGAYPIISQESDFINGYWDNSEDVFSVDSPVVVFGDHTKIIKHIDFDFVLGADGVKILKPIETLSSKFFAYFLNAAPVADLGYARHYRLLKEITVPVPPREEQERIVAILDETFADIEQVRAKTEQNLKNARELFESYLQQVFNQRGEGWVEKTLGDAVIVERGSSPRPIKNFQTDSDDGVNWIKIGDAKEGQKYIVSTREKITKEGAMKSRFVDVGDFILSNSMSFGRPYIMAIPGYIHDGWFVLRLPNDIDSNYFYYLLSSPYVREQFKNLAAGAIVKNISGDLVKKVILPLPSLAEQKKIAEKLKIFSLQVESLKGIYNKKSEYVDELKKSILQKAFSGELTQKENQGAVA